MLVIYTAVLYLILPLVLIRFCCRAVRNNRYFERFPQRFGFQLGIRPPVTTEQGSSSTRFWIHAVSVGEVNAVVPLVQYLKTAYADCYIIITTMTPTGFDRVWKIFSDNVEHCYLPYDYPGSVKRFLDCAAPSLALVMETEIWPNYISACARRNIPMIYTNVRLSEKSFRGYNRLRWLFEPLLKSVSDFAVQSDMDAARLKKLGAEDGSVHITGSMKFEVDMPASLFEAAESVRLQLGRDRPVWVAGSTHEQEEVQILEAFIEIRKNYPDILLVLVPRHPERFTTVFRLCKRFGLSTILQSQTTTDVSEQTEVFLGDTMGQLSLLICASDVAYIGGSLVPTGGHNILEACAAGIAVLFGPYMFNFQEISDQVLSRGAGLQVMNSSELSQTMQKLINDPVLRDQYGSEGKRFVEDNRGALEKVCVLIRKLV